VRRGETKRGVRHTIANNDMYHHVGASLYRLISFMWISGFSVVLLLYCRQMVLPWCR
jgi:hypothetical protein